MAPELELAMAEFIMNVWEDYCHSPGEDMEEAVKLSSLFEEREATAQEIEEGTAPEECDIGDTYWVLSSLGKQVWEIVNQHKLAQQTKTV